MKKKNSVNDSDRRVRLVRRWMATFTLFVISVILFVFCFIFERALWLYVICALLFFSFVYLYIRADKAIQHMDGYTLIQAMHFYLVCLKEGVENQKEDRNHSVCEIAQRFVYAKTLKPRQILLMYNIGGELVRYFKLERLNKYV